MKVRFTHFQGSLWLPESSWMWHEGFRIWTQNVSFALSPTRAGTLGYSTSTFYASMWPTQESRDSYPAIPLIGISSVQFSRSVVSDSLRAHGLQHARPPCPLPTPGVYANSYPLSRWCHPTISSSVVTFSSHLQSFPASESVPMSQLFASGDQNIGVSASTSVLPMNTQDWSPLGWTDWISLQSYPKKTKMLIQKYSWIPKFTAALFTAIKIWKQLKHSTDEWIKMMWHIHLMEY